MDLWLVEIEAWPQSTGRGADVDQKEAGERCKSYPVRAIDMGEAFRMAEAIAMGVRANPMVWRAPIVKIEKARTA